MFMISTVRRGFRAGSLVLVLALCLIAPNALAQEGINPDAVLRVATIGEPPMLDSMATTAASTAAIAHHIFEALFTFDGDWNAVPMLAETMPVYSADGLTLTIRLRDGVLFHDGTQMTADDVVASLDRWTREATRGRGAAPYIDAITADDALTVTITLNEAYAPLVPFMGGNVAAANIMPKAIAESEGPLTQFIGTGPFTFLEWRPDRYIRLTRFDEYQPRLEAPSGYGGARRALVSEIQFIPVPDATTRLAGLLAGQYDFAESLNPEVLARIRGSDSAAGEIVGPPAYPVIIFNVAQGAVTDVDIRRAIRESFDHEAMMLAGLGDPDLFNLTGSWYPPGSAFYSEAGTGFYATHDLEAARSLLEQSTYAGEPIRILTSTQFGFLYNMSIVAAENMRAIGLNVDLQVVEWATLVDRRGDPTAWDAYWTYGNFNPEPTAYTFLVGPGAGNWSPEPKLEILVGMNSAVDVTVRGEWWGKLQELLYTDVPVIRIGEMYGLAGRSNAVVQDDGHQMLLVPFYWNVGLR